MSYTTKISKKIYYHGRIAGLTYQEVEKPINDTVLHLSTLGYEVYHPFIGFTDMAPKLGPLYVKNMYQNSRLSDKAAYERTKWLVRQADIVLVDFEMKGTLSRVAVGAITALIFGDVFEKHTLSVVADDTVYDHAFIRQASDITFQNIEEAYRYLSELSVLNVSR